jgi:GPI mannosyltransferase 3
MSSRKLYYTGALVLLICAFFSEGFNAWDEHFQIIEFAALKLGLTTASALPWEYHFQMRPGFQPFLFYLIYSGFKLFSITDPFVIAFAARLFNAAISFISIILLIRVYEKSFSRPELAKAFILLSLFLWFSVYNSVRFSSDTTSGRVFIIGFSWFLLKKEENFPKYLFIGLMMGLAFIIRYQVGFMIFGFVAWIVFFKKITFRNFLLFSLGFMIAWGAGILTDRWLYGEWTLTSWNYFQQNLVLDKVSGFGRMPWSYYFSEPFMNGIPPFSLVYIASLFVYFIYKPKDIVTWTLLPFLLVHFLIGHKEMRFLFPMTGFMPLLIIGAGDVLLRKRNAPLHPSPEGEGTGVRLSKWITIPVKLFWYTNLVMLVIVTFKPSDAFMPMYRKIWYDYPGATILFYDQESPYYRAKDIRYYRRANLEIRDIYSVNGNESLTGRNILFATMHPEGQKLFPGHSQEVYTSVPAWLRKFNINHWVDRTEFWHLYLVRNTPPLTPSP